MKGFISGAIALFLLSATAVKAQTYTQTTADLAVQALLGPGVVYSNAQFSGDPSQLGLLAGGVNPLEITSGIVLSSAAVVTNTPNSLEFGEGLGLGNNPDLISVANSVPPLIGQSFTISSVHDIAILEFDFVATGSELSFDYIFGSEEYFGFENTQFNDVFAFFLSGPGITGPYDSPAGFPDGATNLAIVPGSDPVLPITISSVNATINNEFFIANSNLQGINVDGLTTTLTVNSDLICGETYHIALAIADCGDGSLKSTVVLREGSFNITSNTITPIAQDPANNFPSETTVEGCIPGQFVLTPPPCLLEDLTVNLVYTGTAQLGVDYESSLPTTATFTLDTEEIVIDIDPLDDDEVEGVETITVSYTYTSVGGDPVTLSGSLNLYDYDDNEPFIVAMDDLFICPGATESETVVIQNGIAPYSILWSTGATTATESFEEGSAGDAWATITDYCGYTFTDSIRIIEPTPLVAENFNICINDEAVLGNGGTPPYSYGFTGTSIILNPETQVFTGVEYGTTEIVITDACGDQVTAFLTVEFCGIPNVFSPNGDGMNDFFEFPGLGRYPNSKLQVWNRWGVLVYENENYRNFWTAEEQPDGTYYYLLLRSDGTVYNGEITILR